MVHFFESALQFAEHLQLKTLVFDSGEPFPAKTEKPLVAANALPLRLLSGARFFHEGNIGNEVENRKKKDAKGSDHTKSFGRIKVRQETKPPLKKEKREKEEPEHEDENTEECAVFKKTS